MNLFDKLKESIKSHEGFSSTIYTDTEGFPTIGFGFKVSDLILDDDIAEMILNRKLTSIYTHLINYEPWIFKMPEEAQLIVIEMCYQLGVDGFLKFKKTIVYLKEGRYRLASEEMLRSKWHLQTPTRAQELASKMATIEEGN